MAREHKLYTTEDEDKPNCICDINGEVVLALCRVCGQGECDLEPTCPGTRETTSDLTEGDNVKTEVERLAAHLQFTMERFDPTPEPEWTNLTIAEQEFYRSCVREILRELPQDPTLLQKLRKV